MNKQLIIILLSVIAVLGGIIFLQEKKIKNSTNAIKVLENNVSSLSQGVATYKVRDSLNAAQVIQLNLRKNEAELLVDSIQQVCRDLNVKYKNLQDYVDMHIESEKVVEVPVYDTIYRDKPMTIIRFKDNWYTLSGVVYDSKFSGKISCRHDIIILDEAIYKGWWIFKKLKRIDVKAMVMNPNDTITSMKSIAIESRRKKRSVK